MGTNSRFIKDINVEFYDIPNAKKNVKLGTNFCFYKST